MAVARIAELTNASSQLIQILYNASTATVTLSDIDPRAFGILYLQPGTSVSIEADRMVNVVDLRKAGVSIRFRSKNYVEPVVELPLPSAPAAPILTWALPYGPNSSHLTDPDQVDLEWTADEDAVFFEIERSLDQSSWTLVDTVESVLEYSDDNSLNAETTYYYRIRAYESSQRSVSEYSNILSADTFPAKDLDTWDNLSLQGGPYPVNVATNSFATTQDTPLIGAQAEELNSPRFFETDQEYAVVRQTRHGTLTLYGNGAFDYTPDAGFSGSDVFYYQQYLTIDDGHLLSCELSITVFPS